MSNDTPQASDPGPLRHFRVGRRALLTSLATGAGVAAFTLPAVAAGHVHHAGAAAETPDNTAHEEHGLLFLDQHAFDTLVLLSEQIVPGARDAKVPEILDRLLSVESLETQKRFTSVIGAFEGQARAAQGKPWKSLSSEQANALLTKISGLPKDDASRKAFDDLKAAVAETYYSTEVGMKEMGWQGNVAHAAPPKTC